MENCAGMIFLFFLFFYDDESLYNDAAQAPGLLYFCLGVHFDTHSFFFTFIIIKTH